MFGSNYFAQPYFGNIILYHSLLLPALLLLRVFRQLHRLPVHLSRLAVPAPAHQPVIPVHQPVIPVHQPVIPVHLVLRLYQHLRQAVLFLLPALAVQHQLAPALPVVPSVLLHHNPAPVVQPRTQQAHQSVPLVAPHL